MKKEDGHSQKNKNEGDMLVVEPVPYSGASAFDAEDYRPYMAEFDLTEEQANELLATLWEIMKAFVDLGFGVDSIHDLFPALNEVSEEIEAHELQSGHAQYIQEFGKSADRCGVREKDS